MNQKRKIFLGNIVVKPLIIWILAILGGLGGELLGAQGFLVFWIIVVAVITTIHILFEIYDFRHGINAYKGI
jgi:hypothetical protein